MAADPEVTLICIDNSEWIFDRGEIYKAQLEAIKFYCETKFECNPENTVALFSMASERFGPQLSPTRDLREIMMVAEGVYYGGGTEFSHAAASACLFFSRTPPDMKKRLLMCVGGPISIGWYEYDSEGYVAELRQLGVALDIVNLFIMDIDESSPRPAILYGTYRYARMDLHTLVALVNDDDDIHIVDVEDEASVIRFLANSILKESLHYLGKNVEASGIQSVKPDLEPFHNEKNESAADDEYFQAPGMKFPTSSSLGRILRANQKRIIR